MRRVDQDEQSTDNDHELSHKSISFWLGENSVEDPIGGFEMLSTRFVRTLAAALAMLTLFAGATSVASAAGKGSPTNPGKGHGGPGAVVVSGTIASVEEDGALLVVDKGELDEDASDDVSVRLTEDTRVVPPDAEPSAGQAVKVVAKKNQEAELVALVVRIGEEASGEPGNGRGDKGEKGKGRRQFRACGTITGLPDPDEKGRALGEWVIEVPGLATYTVQVTAETRIVPPPALPAELGDSACFLAAKEGDAWLATIIQLKMRAGEERGRHAEKVVIRGTVTAIPDQASRTGEWELEIDVAGAEGRTETVIVTPETEIEGELVLDASIVVHARSETDADGNARLVATKIKVVDGEHEQPKAKGAVHFRGTLTDIQPGGEKDELWTVVEEDGSTVELVVNDETIVIGLAEGEDPLESEVVGHAKRGEDGALVARLIRFRAS